MTPTLLVQVRTQTVKPFTVIVLSAAMSLLTTAATATPIIYFGEDLGLGENTVLGATPNADAAQADFLAALINPGVETFEGIAAGTLAPFGINFANGVTATFAGSGQVVSLADGTTNTFGRYGVTGDADADERFLDLSGFGGANAFTLAFSQPVAAFGFFGVDIGDFLGQVTVTTAGGLNQMFNVGNTTGVPGGSVLFWGVVDPLQTFTSVAFGNTSAEGEDVFAFDDFTVGTPQQVSVPEPATLTLLGLGLAIGARRCWRRQQAK